MQHEYTTVLACLVKTFPSKKEFRDLVQLTDYNDPESDFFEHMKHIQVRKKPFTVTPLPPVYLLSDYTDLCIPLLRSTVGAVR